MNAADILILGLIVLSMLLGLLRGFVSGIISLVSWVAAFWVAWAFGGTVATWYAGLLEDQAARFVAGYLTCFLAVLVVGALFGWLMRGLLQRGGLRGDDRLLGMLFGLARGLLLVTAVVFLLGFTALPGEATWWRQSRLLPGFEAGADWLARRLPPEVSGYLSAGGKALPDLSGIPISAVQRHAAPLNGPATSASAQPSSAASTPGSVEAHDHGGGDVGQYRP